MKPEGKGLRAARYGAIPTYMLQRFQIVGYVTRDELAELFEERSIVSALRRMKKAGIIKRTMDKSRKVTFTPVGPTVEIAKPVIPKPVREWSKSQFYTPPPRIPTSVFDLARCL